MTVTKVVTLMMKAKMMMLKVSVLKRITTVMKVMKKERRLMERPAEMITMTKKRLFGAKDVTLNLQPPDMVHTQPLQKVHPSLVLLLLS